MVGGAFMRTGTAGQTPGMGIFPPVEFTTEVLWVAFLYALQKTLWAMPLGGGWSLIGTPNKYPCSRTYCLVFCPAPHIMQQSFPRIKYEHLSVQTPAVPTGLSNFVQNFLGCATVQLVALLYSWMSHGQMVRSSCPALACLGFGVVPQKAPWAVRARRDEGKVPYAIRASSRTLFGPGVSRHWTPWMWKETWAPSKMPYPLRWVQSMDAWIIRLVMGYKPRVNPV